MRPGKIGLDAESLPAARHRVVQPALLVQGIAQVAVCLGVIGLDGESFPVARDRLVQPALLVQGIAQVAVIGGIDRIFLDGLGDQLNGYFMPADFICDHSQQMIGISMIRLDTENLPVNRFRLWQLSGLVHLNSFLNEALKIVSWNTALGLSTGRRRVAALLILGCRLCQFLLVSFLCPVHPMLDLS